MKKGIGVYVGQKEVIAVSLSTSKGIPILDRFAIETIPSAGEAASLPKAAESGKTKGQTSKKKAEEKIQTPETAAIGKALGKIGGRRAYVVTAFNPFQMVARYFEMPYLPHKEWKPAAAYEACRYLPFKLSEVISDFHILESKDVKEDRVLSVTAAAIRTEVLRSHVDQMREAPASVDMVEPVFSAFARGLSIAQTFEQDKTYGFLFLDSDGSVNVTLARNGIVYLSRDFLLAEDRRGNETRFFEELKISFDFMGRIRGSRQIDRVYLAGSGDLIFWADFLTSVFGKEVHFEFALFATKQDIPKNVLCALLVPIGLALRALKHKSPLGDFSLLPPAERETKPERLKRVVGVEFLIVALLFILIRVAIFEPYASSVRRRLTQPRGSEPADLYLASLSTEQLQKMRGDFQEQEQQLRLFSKGKIAIVLKLKAIARTMPASIWFDQITFRAGLSSDSQVGFTGGPSEFEGRELIIEGHCYAMGSETEIKTINDWAKALGEDKELLQEFQKVTVAEVRRDRYLNHETSTFKIAIE